MFLRKKSDARSIHNKWKYKKNYIILQYDTRTYASVYLEYSKYLCKN